MEQQFIEQAKLHQSVVLQREIELDSATATTGYWSFAKGGHYRGSRNSCQDKLNREFGHYAVTVSTIWSRKDYIQTAVHEDRVPTND